MEEKMSGSVIAFWDEYDTTSIGVGAYTNDALLNKYAQGNILEVGCGRGSMLKKISRFETKIGIDPSSQAIEQARELVPETTFKVGVAEKLPFEDCSFDFVYSLEVFEHVKEYEMMILEMKRVLRNGGIGFIQTPNYPIKRFYDFLYFLLRRRSDFKDDYTHVTKFSVRQLVAVVKKHATIEYSGVRNIFGERFFPITLIPKDSLIAKLIGQKSIVIFKK